MIAGTPNTDLREPDSSIIPHLLLYIFQFVALASPPFRYRRWIFCSVITYLAIYVHLHPHFTNNVGLAQPFTIAWSMYMGTLAKLLLLPGQGPEAHFWRTDRPVKEALSYTGFGWRKVIWAVALVFNQRGIRWNFQVKNIIHVTSKGRLDFLVKQTSQFIRCILTADLLFELSKRLFFTPSDGTVGQVNSKHLTLRHHNWLWSFAKVFVFGTTPYFMLSMQYAQFAFIAVLLGLSKPEDWPSPFGRLADTTTVRDFWGKFWHQQLRAMLTSFTNAIASYFKIRQGTTLSSYTKLYLAFLISGLFHAMSQLQMPCPENITFSERTVGFFLFFIWQMVAITIEDFVKWSFRKVGWNLKHSGCRSYVRWVGYVWVMGNMWASLPLAGDTFLRMRMGVDSLLPFSIMRPFVERYVGIPP